MREKRPTKNELLAETDDLRAKVEELQQLVDALKGGEVDAIVASGPAGEQIFTLKGAESAYRTIVESMNEGAATVAPAGTILYANNKLSEMLKIPLEHIIGAPLVHFVRQQAGRSVEQLLEKGLREGAREEALLVAGGGVSAPVYVSANPLIIDNEQPGVIVVITDLSERKQAEEELRKAHDKLELRVYERTKELRESEERLALAQRAGHVGVFDWDLINNKVLWTVQLEELFGLPPGGFEGNYQGWAKYVHPEDRPVIEKLFQQWLQSQQKQVEFEYRITRPDGEIRWIAVGAQFSYLDNGTPARMIGTNTDITEHKVAEESLRESEHFARKVIESSLNGLYIHDLEKRRHVYINTEYEQVTGYTLSELASLGDIFTIIHPDDLATLFDHISAVLSLPEGESLEVEYRIRKPEGSWIWCLSRDSVFDRDPEGKVTHIIGTFIDITERKRAEEALRESGQRYRELVENANSIILRIDPQGRIIFFNEFAQSFFGYSLEEIIGKHVLDTILPKKDSEGKDHSTLVGDILEHPQIYEINESENIKKNGERVWISWTNKMIRDEDGAVTSILSIGQDMTERKKLEAAITHQAYHDILTGLPNKTLYLDYLNLEIAQALRNQRKLAALFLDLDRFKNINDSLGHAAGDQLLQEVAKRLRMAIRDSDTVARIGGDEFTFIVADLNIPEDSARVAEKIINAFNRPFLLEGHQITVTPSIGISVYPDDGLHPEALMKNADIAMYHAKNQGRNNYQFYNRKMNIRTLERMILETSLRKTLENGELVVHYQPQINVKTRRIVCAEALVRWQHPELGLLKPMHFISVAEETGFIVPMDEWVLRTACAQNKAWLEEGRQPMCVTVNLSARQFQQPNLVELVSQILQETGLDPGYLELEITEGTAMRDIEYTIPSLNKLKDLGVAFSIDDFGTGYSSLSHLKRLPLQKLKIDKAFVKDVPADHEDVAIVKAVIGLAHNLNLKVIAEGVETDEQLAFLDTSGCDEIQGYLYSKPLPAKEFQELMS